MGYREIVDASTMLAYVNNLLFKHPYGTRYRYRHKNKTIKLRTGTIYYLGKSITDAVVHLTEPEHGTETSKLIELAKHYKKPVVIIAELEALNPHRLTHLAKIESWEPVFHHDNRIPGFDAYLICIGKKEVCIQDGKPCRKEEEREPSTYRLIIRKGKTNWFYGLLVNTANIARLVKTKRDPVEQDYI